MVNPAPMTFRRTAAATPTVFGSGSAKGYRRSSVSRSWAVRAVAARRIQMSSWSRSVQVVICSRRASGTSMPREASQP
jgi:hypothetical protein